MSNVAEKIIENYSINITIERSVMLKALSRLQNVIEKRNTLPILSNIKLDAKESSLTLTATDMDLVAIEIIPSEITIEGSLTVPAQTLYDIVRKLPDGSQISLNSESNGQLLVKSGTAKFSISCLPSDGFPIMSEGKMDCHFTLPAKECLALMSRPRFAMSFKDSRYYLNGIYLHVSSAGENNGTPSLLAVATDSHRLARVEVALPEGAEDMTGAIVPRKTANELSKILDGREEDVAISLSSTKIRFSCGNITVLSKLVDGTFPSYSHVIPQNNNKILELDVQLLSNSIDRVATISTEKNSSIRIALSNGKIVISAKNSDGSTATEELESNYSAGDFEIGFNWKYLLEILGQLDGEMVQFLLHDGNSSALISDPSDVSSMYVIMPIRG